MRYGWMLLCATLMLPVASQAEEAKDAQSEPQAEMSKPQELGTEKVAPNAAMASALEIQSDDQVLGSADAPVTIVEYASLSCSHCANFHTKTYPELKSRYIDTGKVRFVFRDFPLNAPALRASMLARCSEGERFYNYVKVLFDQQSGWLNARYIKMLENIAKLGGMSSEEFTACMGNQAMETRIIEMKRVGMEALEVKSTPTFFINGEKLSGAQDIEAFAAIIDPLLANMSTAEDAAVEEEAESDAEPEAEAKADEPEAEPKETESKDEVSEKSKEDTTPAKDEQDDHGDAHKEPHSPETPEESDT